MRTFEPTDEWKEVRPGARLPYGVEIRMSPKNNHIEARRIQQREHPETRAHREEEAANHGALLVVAAVALVSLGFVLYRVFA